MKMMWKIKPTMTLSWSELLLQYLKLGNYLLIVPFSVKTEQTGSYQCKLQRKPILAFILLLHLLSVTFSFGWLYVTQTGGHHETLEGVSRVIVMYPLVAYNCILLIYLWTKRNQTERLLNHMRDLSGAMINAGITPPTKITAHLVMALLFCLTVVSTVLEILLTEHQIHIRSSQEITENLLNYKKSLYSPSASAYSPTGTTVVLSLLTVIVEFYSVLLTHYADQLCLVLVFELYFLTKGFISHVKNGVQNFTDTTSLYNKLVVLSDLIDNSHGVLFFFCCFSLLPYYSLRMKEVYNAVPGSRIQFGFYMLTFIFILWAAAETNAQMYGYFAWLRNCACENTITTATQTSSDQALLTVLHLIRREDFGIKGRAFTITYGFIGNVVGLILTYAVIAFQFH